MALCGCISIFKFHSLLQLFPKLVEYEKYYFTVLIDARIFKLITYILKPYALTRQNSNDLK